MQNSGSANTIYSVGITSLECNRYCFWNESVRQRHRIKTRGGGDVRKKILPVEKTRGEDGRIHTSSTEAIWNLFWDNRLITNRHKENTKSARGKKTHKIRGRELRCCHRSIALPTTNGEGYLVGTALWCGTRKEKVQQCGSGGGGGGPVLLQQERVSRGFAQVNYIKTG